MFLRDISHFGVTHSTNLLNIEMGPLSWQLGPIHNIIIWDMILCLFCVSGRGRQQGTARKSSLCINIVSTTHCQRIELALLVFLSFTPMCHFRIFFDIWAPWAAIFLRLFAISGF
jgi:hypothetical protein